MSKVDDILDVIDAGLQSTTVDNYGFGIDFRHPPGRPATAH